MNTERRINGPNAINPLVGNYTSRSRIFVEIVDFPDAAGICFVRRKKEVSGRMNLRCFVKNEEKNRVITLL